MSNEHVPMEETRVFMCFVQVADEIWDAVAEWKPVAKATVGEQLIRAADSVGANLIEGDGRYSDAEALTFFAYARASARETKYWISRATKRKLVPSSVADDWVNRLESGLRMLNSLMTYRRSTKNKNIVKERAAPYASEADPLARAMGSVPTQRPTPNAQRPTPNA